jgi:hypothetical protein
LLLYERRQLVGRQRQLMTVADAKSRLAEFSSEDAIGDAEGHGGLDGLDRHEVRRHLRADYICTTSGRPLLGLRAQCCVVVRHAGADTPDCAS